MFQPILDVFPTLVEASSSWLSSLFNTTLVVFDNFLLTVVTGYTHFCTFFAIDLDLVISQKGPRNGISKPKLDFLAMLIATGLGLLLLELMNIYTDLCLCIF